MDRVERRIVSVLFADLVGFTTLAEQLEPEDVALIQDHYFQRVRDTIACYDGLIEKFIGDAAVAVFGLPVARENDAERAVKAGLAIVRSVEQIGAELSLESDVFSVRVAVNTGEVIFSQMSADSNDWRITGDSVNVAARLQSVARPGSVLMGSMTALSVEAAIDVERAGAFNLKGKSEPVHAWWAIGERMEPSRHHALGVLRAPTVGRDAELALLRETVERVPGSSEVWAIVAPPGVGKSRLVSAFSEELVRSGVTRLWMTRVGTEAAFGYEPISDLLRNALDDAGIRIEERPAAERLLEVRLAESGRTGLHAQVVIEHCMSLAWPEAILRTEDDRDTLFTSWITALDVLAADKPAVWVVDDLHWATPDVLAFLEFGARQPSTSGRLILTTARPSLLETAPHWCASENGVQILHLKNLKKTDARVLVEKLLGPEVLPHALLQQIVVNSDGNPLYVEELIRSWVALNILYLDEDGRWIYKGGEEEIQVPTTVQAIYSAQLDALPPLARQVARLGSIGGRRFPIGALQAMGVAEPEPAISILVKRQLLSGPHTDVFLGDGFGYRHAILRDVAYASLPRPERARFHLRVAKWLEQRPSCSEHAAELVGNHYNAALENASTLIDNVAEGLSRSSIASLASTWLERAAEKALMSAPQSSTLLFQRCLELTPEEALTDQSRLSLHLGEALRRSGDLQSAMATFETAAIKSIAAKDYKTLTSAAIGYEDALFASRLPRATWGDKSVSLLTASLGALSREDSGIRSRALAALGRSQVYGTAPDSGLSHSIEAVEMARRVDDASELAYALLALRSTHMDPERLALRLQEVTELVISAQRVDDKEMELEGQRLRLLDLLERGEIEEAHTAYRQAVALVEELRRPMYFWYPPMWRSMLALFVGSFEEAEESIEHFREEGKRWNYRDVEQVYGVQFFQLHKDRGHPELAQEFLEEMATKVIPHWSPILGSLYAEMGLREKARIQFDVYAPTFTGVVPDLRWSYIMALLCEICAFLQDSEAAGTIHRLLSPWANHNIVLGSGAVSIGSASYFLGLAARTMGDLPAAIEHFDKAISMNEKMGTFPAAIRSRFELARTLRRIGEKPCERLQGVVGLARKIGMDGIAQQASEILSLNLPGPVVTM